MRRNPEPAAARPPIVSVRLWNMPDDAQRVYLELDDPGMASVDDVLVAMRAAGYGAHGGTARLVRRASDTTATTPSDLEAARTAEPLPAREPVVDGDAFWWISSA
jgi:hypothetical protein